MSEDIVIREAAKDVWTFSRPFNLFNRLPVGGRSTAIKLSGGRVWVLASTPLTGGTKQKLAELGEVQYIIAPNLFHNLFLKEYKTVYPSATVIGPEGLNAKLDGWNLDKTFSESSSDTFGFEDEIKYCYFTGHKNKDIAFYYPASKVAIAADLLFNLPASEQYALLKTPPPYFPLANSLQPYGWVLKVFQWFKITDKLSMKRDVRTVESWDFEKFIPCHGNVVENNAKDAWREAFRWYL